MVFRFLACFVSILGIASITVVPWSVHSPNDADSFLAAPADESAEGKARHCGAAMDEPASAGKYLYVSSVAAIYDKVVQFSSFSQKSSSSFKVSVPNATLNHIGAEPRIYLFNLFRPLLQPIIKNVMAP
ncbi:MAG: hypothetical protein LBJ64_08300 [Deltaproteobacteria bacterium]|jgi:hypothetical protein|nr:hypothetical protein [Deltaproteobacteria bacterium]